MLTSGPRLDLGADRRKAGMMQPPCRTPAVQMGRPLFQRRRLCRGQEETRPGGAGPRDRHPRKPRAGAAGARSEPASRHGLRGAFHGAGVHLALSHYGAAGLRASRHRLRAQRLAGRIQVAEALPGRRSATTARSTRIARSPSASGWRRCWSRTTCASAATGIRAAASPSMCSGRPARPPTACGCPTRASRPTAGAADRSGRRTSCWQRDAACSRRSRG